MDHGLPVAIDGDDGTGRLLHARAVVQQAILQRLQLLAQALAFLLQGFGLVLVVFLHGRIHGFTDGLHPGLQLLDALRFALVRFAALPRGALEGLQVGMGHGGRDVHPSPAFRPHLGGNACQLVLRQPLQQGGIIEVHPRVVLREQVAADAAACGFVGIQPDEARQRMPIGVNLALGQALAQGGRTALPLRRIVERGVLHRRVIGHGQCHELIQRHGIGAVVGHQARRHVGELQAAPHHQRRDGEVGGDVLDGTALGH